MSILISCACGKSYPIKEQFAGQRVQCPACQRVLTVPGSTLATAATKQVRPARPTEKEEVIDLAVVPKIPAPKRSAPARVRQPEQILDLSVVDDDDPQPHSSAGLAVILAVFFVLVLGGGGTAVYFLLQKEDDTGSPVAATDKGKPSEKDDKKPPREKIPEIKDPEKKDPEKKDPEKKDPERKDPEKKDPEDKVPAVLSGPWLGHTSRILGVGFARDGRTAFSAAGGEVLREGKKALAPDSTLRVWDPATGKELKRLDGFAHGLSVAAFDPTGALAVLVDIPDDRPGAFDLHVWDMVGKRELRALQGHERGVVCAAFTADGRRLLSGGRDARLRVWDVEGGTQVGDGFAHPGTVNDVAVTGDGRLAVTACGDRTVRVIDLVEKKVKEFGRHQDIVWCVAVSPDGKYAASGGGDDYDATLGQFVDGSRDYDIRLWDLGTGQEVRRFRGHAKRVTCLAFSADGRRLLSGGRDKTVRLWHVATGRDLGKFDEPTDWVQSVAFFPDGRRSLSGGYDRTLRVWTLPPDVGDLAKQLLDPKTDRLETLNEIGRYGPEAKDAVPVLLKLLGDADPEVKRTAMATLSKVGTAGKEHVELLVPLLKDAGFPAGRQFALDALAVLGADARPALPALLGLLQDMTPATRLKAIGIVAAVGADAKATAFTPLLELLRDPDAEVAKAAADALSKLGKPTKSELPTLTTFVSDKGEPVRRYALLALTDLGDEARPALPAILHVLEKDPSAPLRLLALEALLKVQPAGKALIEPLSLALKDADPKVPLRAAEALAALPPETGVLPALVKAMEHDDPAVQKVADDALEKYPFTKEHVALINEGLQSKREPVRMRMLKAATMLGADAAGAVPGLIAIVKNSTGEVQTSAINALSAIGPAAREAGPALAALLKDGDRKARLAICLVLGKIGAEESKQALPFLVGLLKVENLEDEEAKKDRETAKQTLIQIGEPAVDELLKALAGDFAGGNPNTPIGLVKGFARLTALETLTEIGTKSKVSIRRALGPLVAVQRSDPIPAVQQAARAAYKAMQK